MILLRKTVFEIKLKVIMYLIEIMKQINNFKVRNHGIKAQKHLSNLSKDWQIN